ncbi:YqaA family protein [Fulvimarina sp. MAC3]|uniref:YqaA family protein n=1 Tax=Fulvimarina sp. MAC3 TaxID=3148887 RepID=UPI0031FDDE94
MLRRLYDWVMSLAATRHAERALAAVSFIESSIFPIPPDALLIPMVIANREKWARIALVCTVSSVLGAFLGYAIGYFFFELVGQPILDSLGKGDSFDKLQAWYDVWGGWAVFFAALTPFPYKVLTIFSGFAGYNILLFTVVSIIGRGARFFLVAWLLHKYGSPIQSFIEKRLGLLFILFMVFLIGGFVALRYIM